MSDQAPTELNDIGEAFYYFIAADPAIVALVGSRVRPVAPRQDEVMPCLTYQILSSTGSEHLTGHGGLIQSRLRIRSYADNRRGANDLAKLVHDKLIPKESASRQAWSTLNISGCSVEAGPFDEEEEPRDASDSWRIARVYDYRVSWFQP